MTSLRVTFGRAALTFAAVLSLVVGIAPSSDASLLDPDDPLGGLIHPVKDLLDDLLDSAVDTVGGLDESVQIALDTPISGLVDAVVGALTDTIATLLQPGGPDLSDPAGLVPSIIKPLQQIEALDGVVEDVVHPTVVQPVADGIAPVVGAAEPVLTPFGPTVNTGVDAVYDGLGQVVSALGLEVGAYEAVVTTPDGSTRRTGVVDVPTLLDVNGDGLQDITLEVRVITARPSIRVSRLPGSPADLPVRVEAVIAPTGGAERLSVGFDALDATLPDVVRATLTDDGSTSGELGVELHAVDPGSTLAVVAAVYDQGPSGPIDPTEVRVGFTPMPTDVTATVQGALDGGDDVGISLALSEPSTVEAAIRQTAGATLTELGATIDQAPNSIAFTVARAGGGVDVTYAASAPVDRIALHQSTIEPTRTRFIEIGVEGIDALEASLHLDPEQTLGISASAAIDALTLDAFDSAGLVGRATTLRLRIEGIPSDLDVDLGEDGVGLDALGGRIGLLEVQLTSGPDLFLPTGTDGVIFRDTPAVFLVAARLTGLKKLTGNLSPTGILVELLTDGGQPFLVDAITGDQSILATIDSLPASVEIGAGPDGLHWAADRVVHALAITLGQGSRTTAIEVTDLPSEVDVSLNGDAFTWTANATTPLVLLELSDPAGVLDRATSVRARVEDLPPSLTVALGAGDVSLLAGAPIGLIEILATSGPELSLPLGTEGLLVRDTPADQVITARLTGVLGLMLGSDPLSFSLQTDHTRVLTIDMHTEAADGSATDLLATIDQLPTDVSLSLVDNGGGSSSIAYTGNAVVDSVNASLVRTTADQRTTTATLLVLGLPTALSLDLGDEAFGYTASGGIPRLELDLTDPDGLAGRANRLAIRADDLPQEVAFSVAGGTPGLSVPSGEIGLLEALLTSGPELSVPPGTDGILLRDDPSQFVVALRVTGLRGLSLDPSGTGFSLQTAGGRLFVVDVLQVAADSSSTSLIATLDTLPADVSIALGELTGGLHLDYDASAVMDHLTAQLVSTTPGEPDVVAVVQLDDLPTAVDLDVDDTGGVTYTAADRLTRLQLELTDPAGVFSRATELRLTALDLPTSITATLDDLGGLSLVTGGGPIGLVEALITNGPVPVVPVGVDGLVLRDTASDFAVALRITSLLSLAFTTTDGGAELELGTAAGRPLVVEGLIEDVDSTTALSAALTNLPSLVSLNLSNADATSLVLSASSPLDRLGADVELTDADGTTTFDLTAEELPTDLTLAIAADGTIDYTGSGPLARLAVAAVDPAGIFAGATELNAELLDLPSHVTVQLGDDGSIVLDAHGGTLGLLSALARSSASVVLGLDPGVDGVVLLDQPGEFGALIRVTGLHRVSVVPGPISVGLETEGGRTFVIDATLRTGGVLAGDLGDVDIDAALEPLPEAVTLGFAEGDLQQLSLAASDRIDSVTFSLAQYPAGGGDPLTAAILIEDAPTALELGISITGTVQYVASQVVPLLTLDAHDPNGLFDRADTLKLRLESLPLALDLGLSDTGAVDIDAHGGTLGLMEAQATTGPNNQLPAANDGVLFEDLVDRFVVFARFTALKRAIVTQNPLPNVSLTAAGGRPLDIQLYESAPGKPAPAPNNNQEFTKMLLTGTPPVVNLALLPGAVGQLNVSYTGSVPATSLSLQTNGGDRWLTTATISNPVPVAFSACQSSTRSCIPSTGTGPTNVGSIAFVASEPTTLDVFDCVRPLTTACRRTNAGGSPTQYIDVANLRMRTFRFTGNVVQSGFLNCCVSGNTFLDTGNAVATGAVNYVQSSSQSFQFTFNPGFIANNRAVTFTNVIPGVGGGTINSQSGTITCGNFSFNVKVSFLGIPLTLSVKRIFAC